MIIYKIEHFQRMWTKISKLDVYAILLSLNMQKSINKVFIFRSHVRWSKLLAFQLVRHDELRMLSKKNIFFLRSIESNHPLHFDILNSHISFLGGQIIKVWLLSSSTIREVMWPHDGKKRAFPYYGFLDDLSSFLSLHGRVCAGSTVVSWF